MVSHRNFFTIMTLLGIMVFMFMFVSVIKQEFHTYDTNTNGSLQGEMEREELAQRFRERQDRINRETEVYFLTGDDESPLDQVIDGWCMYTGRAYAKGSNLGEMPGIEEAAVELIVVNGQSMDPEEVDQLSVYASQGGCIVFATLPSPGMIEKNEKLRELLGIRRVYSQMIWLKDLHLLPGLLLGGEMIYPGDTKNLNRSDEAFHIPWYMVGEGTKTYMMGTVEDSILESQYMPAVIWRNTVGRGKVFCVNGDFMKSMSGMGFLTAFLAEKDSYDIYPVVNAQNLVLFNYCGFSNENSEKMMEEYSQSQTQFFRDVVWPSMIAMNERTFAKISMMAAIQTDYEDDQVPVPGELLYYLKLLKENNGEAGLSGDRTSATSLEEKLDQDLQYWERECATYEIRSAYLSELRELSQLREKVSTLRSVVTSREGLLPVSYGEGMVTLQNSTSNGKVASMEEDLTLKLYETLLGYSCITVDLAGVSRPEEGIYWEIFIQDLTKNLGTYWQDFKEFDQTTISESDSRIRQLLALEYRDVREADTVTLYVEGLQNTAYFIIKLNREEIDPATTVKYRSLGNGFYLLEVGEKETRIPLRKPQSFYYESLKGGW